MNNFKKNTLVFFSLLNCFLGVSQEGLMPMKWSIQQCIEQAWESNITVKQTEISKVNSNYDLEFNLASYHPNLNLSYSNGYNWGRSIDPTTYQFVTGGVNTNNLTLSSSMTLFDGFATPNRIKQSKVGVKLAEGEMQLQKNSIAISIASLYLQVLLAHEREAVVSNQLTISRELLKISSKNVELGIKPELDLLQIKSQIVKEKADSVAANNTLRIAKLTLMQLIELPYSLSFEIERFDPKSIGTYTVVSKTEEVYDSALAVVPEIQNANLMIHYKELDLKVKKGGYYPILSLNGRVVSNYASSSKKISRQEIAVEKPIGYLYNDPTQTVVGNQISVVPIAEKYPFRNQLSDNLNSSLSLVLSIPIYSKKQNKVNTGKAFMSIDQAKLDLQNRKNILRKDIEMAHLDYVLLNNQLISGEEKLKAYLVSYAKFQKQFDLNISSSYELLLEKNKVTATENEIIQLQYQLLFKNIILKYYQSGEIELPKINNQK